MLSPKNLARKGLTCYGLLVTAILVNIGSKQCQGA